MNEQDFFLRYLTAKKTVEDRALNNFVWNKMANKLKQGPMKVLEIGAGIGSMIERLHNQGLLDNIELTAIDYDPDHIEIVKDWAAAHDQLAITLETIDVFDFIAREQGQQQWDMVIAHAFLDLVDIPHTLPQIFSLLKPEGHFYFPINFDGGTIFEPSTDPWFDTLVEKVYHRTMDERKVNGRLSGDSKSGRHLFTYIQEAGGQITAAGSSDWVVHPGEDGYEADEAFFLETIVKYIEKSLTGRPEIDPEKLDDWVDEKLVFIKRLELIYIAHQIDLFGKLRM